MLLESVACARLIGNYSAMTIETSGPAVAVLLQVAGFDAHWVRPPGKADLKPGDVVMEIHYQEELRAVPLPGCLTMTPGWTLQMGRSELDRYMIELVQPGTWIARMKHLLAARRVGRPWPHYRNEHEGWP
ncbi:hypothetical protein KQY30_09140 [Streptomyces sp. GMY02]|uniref:hypothetical protein n=1 Tax=Streptomyces sp. GMY02 TaxID=1333528 RepID=UPI001C2BEF36|nr:hypothetical protein [Streptomyces sp. GMY02]QXE34427.1 hypothetical protein KQY30_09140 [Streptomyces sp. GMY02]